MKSRPDKRKQLTDAKKIKIIILIVALIVSAYALRAVYYGYTGAVKTETINTVTDYDKIEADGIVIRDEGKKVNGSNSSILNKTENAIYSPVVSDGESVAKNECIAYIFSDESQAKALSESDELSAKIASFSKLQESGNIGRLDVGMLNSEIASSIKNYISLIDSNDFTNLESNIENICYLITSKQIITGEKIDFSSEIDSLKQQLEQLKSSVEGMPKVTAPCAGYFVSDVDGYENLYDYEKAGSEGFTTKEINKLKKLKPEVANAYGKIISQHTWYFAFNIPFLDSSRMKVGDKVRVDFTERGISGVEMTVCRVNRSGEKAAVVLKCLTMNDKLLYLRREKAVINIGEYTGLKISTNALKKYDEDGTIGVFVLEGKCAVMKPIRIIYSSDDYVIASPVTKISSAGKKDKDNDDKQSDEEYIDENHILKPYDKIIVKGRNLYDGKVVG